MKKLFKIIGIKTSVITIVINFFLFAFKLILGLFSHSKSLISDAIHSLSDVFTTIIVIFGFAISSKEADENHPYGHERIESAFAILLAFILFLTGVFIGIDGINASINSHNTITPGLIGLIGAITSIIVKEIMFQYTIRIAKKINSPSLKGDAWHHRSDAISSVGSFIAILGAKLGLKILDPLMCLLICILIIKTSIDIFLSAISSMIDTSCDKELENEILKSIIKCSKYSTIIDLKTRMFGSKIYIDLTVAMDGNIPLKKVDKIRLKIHDTIESKFKLVKHINILVIPLKNN